MKKKLLFVFLSLTFVLALAFGLSACGREGGGKPSGDSTTHTHTMTHHEKQSATCTKAGNVEYWSCSGCGKNFADKNGNKALSTVTVKATGHSMTYHAKVEATCIATGNAEYYSCSKCRKNFKDVNGVAEMASVTIPATNNHSLYMVWSKEATCTEPGMIAHVKCNVCGKCFINGKEVDTVMIPAKGHTYSEEWTVEDDVHYRKAICEHTDEFTDYGKHSYNAEGFCVCGATVNQTIRAYINHELYNVVYTNAAAGYKITAPQLPDGMQNGTEINAYYDGWYLDLDCMIPFTGETVFSKAEYPDGANIFALGYKSVESNFTFSLSGGEATVSGLSYIGKTRQALVMPLKYNGCPVTAIGGGACKEAQVQRVLIGDNIKKIGSGAFNRCGGLTVLKLGKQITSIEDGAFYGCSGLTSVTIPDSVTSIGSSAFNGCSGLESIIVDENNATYASQDGILYNKAKTEFVYAPFAITDSVTIPDSVTSIGNYAFRGRSGLTSVTIGDSVTSIGYEAFYGCSGLTSVTIGNSVTSIGERAFVNCSRLTSVTIGNSVTSIGWYAFEGCGGLTSVRHTGDLASWCKISGLSQIMSYGSKNKKLFIGGKEIAGELAIPDSVTSIGDYAFYGCSGLTSVTIPDSVTLIWKYAFGGCSGLMSVTIPDSVTSIGGYAFGGCSGLMSVTFENTSDWKVDRGYGYTWISESILSNPATAATYLKSTYDDYTWSHD